MRWEAVAVVAVLVVLSFSSFLPVPQSSGSTPITPAASQSLTTYTTPLSLTFAPPRTGGIRIDMAPAPFTFYPNGTVLLLQPSGVVKLAWSFAIIPLQAPTSFQANSSYVVYSAKGPGPNCFVNVGFKQASNTALFSMFGTSAQPCASSTFSIKLSAYSASLQAFNATGGTAGTICDVFVSAIQWNFCAPKLVSASISYNAGTIQVKNTAHDWSVLDPIAIDGSATCAHGNGASTCTTGTFTDVSRNDLLLALQYDTASLTDCQTQIPTDGRGLTWRLRNDASSSGSEVCEWYAQWDGQGTDTVTFTQGSNAKGGGIVFGISDAMIKPPSFDTGLCANQLGNTATTATTTMTQCDLTSYNRRSLLIGGLAFDAASPTITAGSGFTLVGSCVQASAITTCAESELTTSPQTTVATPWIVAGSQNNHVLMMGDTIEEFKPDIVQTTSCSFTTNQHPTCAFANNLVAGDTILVVPFADSNAASVSTVTDSQSLGISKITSEGVQAGSEVEGWGACNVATAAGDTITVNWDASRSGFIVIYELTPLDASCSIRSSVGSGASGGFSVTSYTPLNASLVIAGGVCSNTNLAISHGTGYIRDNSLIGAAIAISGNTEHATNNGTAETSPNSGGVDCNFPGHTPWNEISMSFVRPTPNALVTTTTIEPIGCTASTTIPQTNTALFSTTLSSTQPLTLSSTESETSTLSGTLLTTSTRITSQSKMTTTITIPITLSTTSTVSETQTLTEETTFSQTIPVTQGTTSSTTQSLTLTCTGASATATITSTTSTTTTSPTTTTVTTGGGGKADPPNFDWLLLIPVFFVLAYLIARRR